MVSEQARPVKTDDDIDEALAALEGRKVKLQKLLTLRMEVSMLEIDAMLSGTGDVATVKIVLEEVSREFKVPQDQLCARTRVECVIIPRHVAFFLIRTLTKMPFQPIGKMFNRDHGTVMGGCRHVRDKMETNPQFSETVAKLMQQCASRLALAKIFPAA